MKEPHKNAIVINPENLWDWIKDLCPKNWSKTGGHYLIQDEEFREKLIENACQFTRTFVKEMDNE